MSQPVSRDHRMQPDSLPVALVASDELVIAMFVSAILGARGWRVLKAADSDVALAQANGHSIGLLVVKDDLPGISSESLTNRLAARNPGLAVLVVSMKPEDVRWAQGSRRHVIPWPCGLEQLAERVDALIGLKTSWRHLEADRIPSR